MDFFNIHKWIDISNMTTIKTDIFVFVDTYWPFNWVADYVVFVLQNLNIHPYASTVTLFAASTGSVIVNTTDYIITLYEYWNMTSHSSHQPGFTLPIILNTVSTRAEQLLAGERINNNIGGRSLIALLVPSPIAFVDEHDYDYCLRYLHRLSDSLPSLEFVYYGGGALIRFHDFVEDPSRDLYFLNTDLSPVESGMPVVQRLWQVPRRISSPRCYSNGVISEYGTNSLEQYARPGSINFYRLDAVYMQSRQSMRYLKVSAVSQIVFTVCTSRSIHLPFRNATAPLRKDEVCEPILHSQSFSYDLTDACTDYDQQRCPPLYFSVQPQNFGDIVCAKPECQTPDEAQYVISVNNLGCSSSSTISQPSLRILIFIFLSSIMQNVFLMILKFI